MKKSYFPRMKVEKPKINKSGYESWSGMKQRCLNPKDAAYHRYGGRGITVCEAWLSYNNFIRDMGPRPSTKHSIDRIDNDKGYYPENCRWATWEQQQENKPAFLIIKGKPFTYLELFRRNAKKTQKDFASMIGITQFDLSRMENRHIANVSVGINKRMTDFFGKEWSYQRLIQIVKDESV